MRLFFVLALCSASGFAQTATRLSDVRKVYVAKMDNHLDESIREEIAKRFGPKLTVVDTRAEADGVLTQTKIDPLQKHEADINLTDAGGKAVLWSSAVGDGDIWVLGMRHVSTRKVAARIVVRLKKAMLR